MLNGSERKSNSSYLSLKTLYEENITVKSIAQELEFCHKNDLALDIQKALEKKNFDILAVQDQGEIIGYIEREELGEGKYFGIFKKLFTKGNGFGFNPFDPASPYF